MTDSTPDSAKPAPMSEDADQMRWSLERLNALSDSYVEAQRYMETKAYRSAAAFAVILAVSMGLCDGMCGTWGCIALAAIAVTGFGTIACLWLGSLVSKTDDLNPRALWDETLKAYPTAAVLRTANESAVEAAESQLAEASRRATWALRTQIVSLLGIGATLLTVLVLRACALK